MALSPLRHDVLFDVVALLGCRKSVTSKSSTIFGSSFPWTPVDFPGELFYDFFGSLRGCVELLSRLSSRRTECFSLGVAIHRVALRIRRAVGRALRGSVP